MSRIWISNQMRERTLSHDEKERHSVAVDRGEGERHVAEFRDGIRRMVESCPERAIVVCQNRPDVRAFGLHFASIHATAGLSHRTNEIENDGCSLSMKMMEKCSFPSCGRTPQTKQSKDFDALLVK